MSSVHDVDTEARSGTTIFRIAKRRASLQDDDDDSLSEQEGEWRDGKRQKGEDGEISSGKGSYRQGLDEQWNLKYDTLVKYQEGHDHTNVPPNYEMNGIKLGRWVQKQRKQYRQKELRQDRFKKLNNLGFEWHPTKTASSEMNAYQAALDKKWNEKFDLLKEYQKEHHHTNVPSSCDRKYLGLGDWVRWQRGRYREKKLKQDRVDKLNDISFEWTAPMTMSTLGRASAIIKHRSRRPVNNHSKVSGRQQEYRRQWNNMFGLLKDFQEKNGHTRVSRKYEIKGKKLGAWVDTQRRVHREKTIQKVRYNKLKSIGFEWNNSAIIPSPEATGMSRAQSDGPVAGHNGHNDLSSSRNENLTLLPISIKRYFRQIGFATFNGKFCPALFLDPYDLAPCPARILWFRKFEHLKKEGRLKSHMPHLVYWYGEALDRCYGFIPPAKYNVFLYDKAIGKRYHNVKHHYLIVRAKSLGRQKLSKQEQGMLPAVQELYEDLKKSPRNRRRGNMLPQNHIDLENEDENAQQTGSEDEAEEHGFEEDEVLAPTASSSSHPHQANATSVGLDVAKKVKQRAEAARAKAEEEKTLAEADKIQAEATLMQAQGQMARAEAKKMQAQAKKIKAEARKMQVDARKLEDEVVRR